jgi:hypothetical protein
MSLRPLLLSSAILLACASPAGAAGNAEEAPFESLSLMHAVGTLVAEPDGSVSSVQLDTKVESQLRAAVEHAVAGLHFKPVRVGGVAQRIRAGFDVSLAARAMPDGKKFAVAIDGIDFKTAKGAPVVRTDDEGYDLVADGRMTPPVYPRDAERVGAMGRVLLALRFDATGKVQDVAVIGSMLYDTHLTTNTARRSIAELERAAVAVAHKWRAKVIPGKTAPGEEGYTATTAVIYTLSRTFDLEKDGQWLAVQRLPSHPIPWKKQDGEVVDSGRSEGFVAMGGSGLELEHSARGTPVL